MKKKKQCHCHSEFDAEVGYKRLLEKHNQLAELVAIYLSQSGTEPTARTAKAREMADVLIKIVGGKKVKPGDYPHCCLIGQRNQDNSLEWFCSGVLVSPTVVLTAAHCFNPAARYVVALNAIDMNQLSSAEIINAKKVIQHPQYAKNNDVCVIVLAKKAETPFVQMATTEEIITSKATTLVGFGNEDVMSTVGFGVKREVTVSFTSMKRSAADDMSADENTFDYDSDLELVAGGNGYDSCNGDSGGPAYIRLNGTLKLAGLTSRSTLGANAPCGEGGVYSRVDAFLPFFSPFIQ